MEEFKEARAAVFYVVYSEGVCASEVNSCENIHLEMFDDVIFETRRNRHATDTALFP